MARTKNEIEREYTFEVIERSTYTVSATSIEEARKKIEDLDYSLDSQENYTWHAILSSVRLKKD